MDRRTCKSKLGLREQNEVNEDLPAPLFLTGYAATFNVDSEDLGGWVERLAPGCFTKTLQSCDARAFFNHCYDHVLGRMSSGTLKLWEDEKGLAFEITLPNTQLGRDIHELVKRGDVDGVSFGFFSVQDEWSADAKINTVLEAELIEISPVVFPAYPNGPTVQARSIDPSRLSRRPAPRFPRLDRARSLIRLDAETF